HKNLDYLETLGYHFGDFFSAGGVVGPGMVTLHPVGLPHGPKPRSLQAFMDGANAGVHNEVGIMADFANPTRVSEWALGLSRPDYMSAWSGYTSDPRFTYAPGRLAEVRALGERLADARDALRPPTEGDARGWVHFPSRSRMPCDVVVIGAGSAGCAVAAALAESGVRRIGLVEAGPDYGARAAGRWPAALLDPRRGPDTHDWNYEMDRGDGTTPPESRARVVSGCSAPNQCAIVR